MVAEHPEVVPGEAQQPQQRVLRRRGQQRQQQGHRAQADFKE